MLGDCESAADDSQLTSPYISVSPITPASSSSSLPYKMLGKEDPGGHVKDRDGLGRQPQARPENHRVSSKPSKKSHHKTSKHHLATESPLSENSSLAHVTSVNFTSSPSQALKSQHHVSKISSHSKPVSSSTTQLAIKKEPKTEDSYRKTTAPLSPSSSSLLPKQKKHKKNKHKLEKQQSENFNLTKPSYDKPATSLFTTAHISHPPPPLRRSSSSGAAETTKSKSDVTSQAQSVLRNSFPLKTTSESASSEKQKKKEKKSKREKAEHSSIDSKPKPAQAASFALSQSASDGIVGQKPTNSEFLNRSFQKPFQSSSTSSLTRHTRPAKLSIQTRYKHLIPNL